MGNSCISLSSTSLELSPNEKTSCLYPFFQMLNYKYRFVKDIPKDKRVKKYIHAYRLLQNAEKNNTYLLDTENNNILAFYGSLRNYWTGLAVIYRANDKQDYEIIGPIWSEDHNIAASDNKNNKIMPEYNNNQQAEMKILLNSQEKEDTVCNKHSVSSGSLNNSNNNGQKNVVESQQIQHISKKIPLWILQNKKQTLFAYINDCLKYNLPINTNIILSYFVVFS